MVILPKTSAHQRFVHARYPDAEQFTCPLGNITTQAMYAEFERAALIADGFEKTTEEIDTDRPGIIAATCTNYCEDTDMQFVLQSKDFTDYIDMLEYLQVPPADDGERARLKIFYDWAHALHDFKMNVKSFQSRRDEHNHWRSVYKLVLEELKRDQDDYELYLKDARNMVAVYMDVVRLMSPMNKDRSWTPLLKNYLDDRLEAQRRGLDLEYQWEIESFANRKERMEHNNLATQLYRRIFSDLIKTDRFQELHNG